MAHMAVQMVEMRIGDAFITRPVGRQVRLALYTIFATFALIWSSGWIAPSRKYASSAHEAVYAYEKSLERIQNTIGSYKGASSTWWNAQRRIRPSTGSVTPFSTFHCLGDDNVGDHIYTRPFRFHVYSNMPGDLYNDSIVKASVYWKPDHR